MPFGSELGLPVFPGLGSEERFDSGGGTAGSLGQGAGVEGGRTGAGAGPKFPGGGTGGNGGRAGAGDWTGGSDPWGAAVALEGGDGFGESAEAGLTSGGITIGGKEASTMAGRTFAGAGGSEAIVGGGGGTRGTTGKAGAAGTDGTGGTAEAASGPSTGVACTSKSLNIPPLCPR